MEVYQPLNWTFNVSKEWSKAVGPVILEELLMKALHGYHLGHRGIVTMNGVSALVIDEGFGQLFIRVEEKKGDRIRRSDVLLPVKASIVKLEHGMPTERFPVYDLPVKLTREHQFSDWFELRSDRFKIVTAAPVLEDIFEAKGITGEEMYNYALETIYRTHKGLLPRKIFVQPAHTGDSIAFITKVSGDQWEMEYFNRLVPPERSSCYQILAYPWIACGYRMSENPT